ncbi:MAG TPA: secondary thiamine-phosphate synthase enzyme YjbQ [Spirochaetota bacterium]
MKMKTITVRTRSKDDLIDITGEISQYISETDITEGMCVVFTPHTTAAITINENADPDVQTDMISGLNGLAFERMSFRHGEGNSPAHIKSSLIGCSETIIIHDGKPVLGTWQGIYLCEFDGPRTRKVHIQVL